MFKIDKFLKPNKSTFERKRDFDDFVRENH